MISENLGKYVELSVYKKISISPLLCFIWPLSFDLGELISADDV